MRFLLWAPADGHMDSDGSLIRNTLYLESCHDVDDHLMRGSMGAASVPTLACVCGCAMYVPMFGPVVCARGGGADILPSLGPFTPFKRARERQS